MGRHLRKFEDIANYEIAKPELERPCVSLISNTRSCKYDPYIHAVKFIAKESDSTIGLEMLSSYHTLQYSEDGVNWNEFTLETTIQLNDIEDYVYLRGILSNNNSMWDYTQFKMTGKIAACGNCNCLWNYKNPEAPLKDYCGYLLFRNCTSLVSAPELPSMTLSNRCYYGMFNGTGIDKAPELNSYILTEYCYSIMFGNCTSLTVAPELPALKLAKNCYSHMFSGCTSLVKTPDLPATELAPSCYSGIVSGTGLLPDITNIDFEDTVLGGSGALAGLFEGTPVTDEYLRTILPINSETGNYYLPATELNTRCYYEMFRDCTSLTTAPDLPATTLSSYCYKGMFQGCTSLTKAPELPKTSIAPERCYDSLFYGCTSLTKAPELSATTLGEDCYWGLFYGCTSLVEAPELPADVLSPWCYAWMFFNCTNLKYIKCLAKDISADRCTLGWTRGISSEGTFVKDPSNNSWSRGENGIPENWTVQDAG